MASSGKETLFMHCLPAERDREVTDGVMEAEEVTEKARVLGITVDIQMLEFVVGLFGTTAYTIYQNLSGA